MGHFYYFIFKVTDIFFCLLHSTVEPICWVLHFDYCIVLKCLFGSFFKKKIFSIFLWHFLFFLFISSVIVIAYSNSLMTIAYIFLLNNFYIYVILVLAFVDCLFLSKFRHSWFLVYWLIFYFILDILNIIWNIDVIEYSVSASLFCYRIGRWRGWSLACYHQVEVDIYLGIPLTSSLLTPLSFF